MQWVGKIQANDGLSDSYWEIVMSTANSLVKVPEKW